MSTIGIIHLVSALAALLTGTVAVLRPGVSLAHRRWGYGYVVSMAVMLGTAFMIYRMFGSWGAFHYMAVVSTLTLAGGMVPLLLRSPQRTYLYYHLAFMYWSLAGLYAALVAETATRLLPQYGWSLVIGGTLVTMLVANIIYRLRKTSWMHLAERHHHMLHSC